MLFHKQDRCSAFLPAALRDLDPVQANFSNVVQLTGARLLRDEAGLTLKLRWQILERVFRSLRCFAHVLVGDRLASSLDHEILRQNPHVRQWEVGDEGYESLRLWLADTPQEVKVRLGIYDPHIDVRLPVLASTLPVTDESSAVILEPGVRPQGEFTVRFQPAPARPCNIFFESGLNLRSYAVARCEDLVRLRLKWILRGRRRVVRFFGHLLAEQVPEGRTLLQFDQDFAARPRGPATEVVQNIVRLLPPSVEPGALLRAGLFYPSSLYRLKILSSDLPFDARYRCLYLPFLLPPRQPEPPSVVDLP